LAGPPKTPRRSSPVFPSAGPMTNPPGRWPLVIPMSTRTLAAKDFRLLRRDYRSAIILLLTPLVFVAVLSLVVGQGFGQKPDNRLRVSVVNRDAGLPPDAGSFPGRPWSEVVLADLAGTADIRIEMIESRELAEQLVRDG